jgi:hypothetical protein
VYGDSVASDAAGRFFVPLHSRPAERVQITLVKMGVGRRDLELNDVPAEGLELGDVELARTPDVHFVVRDASGQPIAGAVARTGGELPSQVYSQSEPTDSRGRGVIADVMPTRDEVRFMALGYEPRVMSVLHDTTSGDSPLEVRLTPRLLLTIEVRRTDRSPAANALVVLSTWEPNPLFPDKSSGRDLMHGELGASSAKSTAGGPPSAEQPTLVVKYKSDHQGRVIVDGWRPLGRLNVRLEGRAGETIASHDVDLVWLGQRETIELVIPDETRTLEIRVVDERADPVASATVSTVSGSRVVLAVTKTDGIASITPLYGTTIDVRVEKGTMCPAFVEGILLNAALVRRDVVLRDGHSVRVRTVDSESREVAVTKVEARWNGRNTGLPQRLKDETSFTIHALPGEIVELAAYLGGRVFRVNHDARTLEAEILLPTSGRVLIEVASPLDLDRWHLVQLAADDDPAVVLRERFRPDSTDPFVGFPIVFPGGYSAELRELDGAGTPLPPIARESAVVVRPNETTVVRLRAGSKR